MLHNGKSSNLKTSLLYNNSWKKIMTWLRLEPSFCEVWIQNDAFNLFLLAVF